MVVTEAANEIFTPKQIAERLGITERSVREKVYAGLWPHLRIDKRTIRFTENDFGEIISNSQRRPAVLVRKVSINQTKNDLALLLKARRVHYT